MFALVLALGTTGAACGGGGGSSNDSDEHHDEHHTGGEDSDEHHDEHAGEDLASYEGPVAGNAAAGAQVFANFCAGCHPNGQAGVGDDLTTSGDSPAQARRIIRNGESRMPAFGEDRISGEDLENLLAHLQTYGMFQ